MRPSWKFGNNDTRENEGPNNAGISNFTDDRTGGLVREIIQNSIDARASDTAPVEVSFQVDRIPTRDLDLTGLKRAMNASIASHANDDRHKKQFERGAKTLNRAIKTGHIVALKITDRNTNGASDEKGLLDKWHSLTKTVGLSAKDLKDSGGSFGIGKHAAFAISDLRTVLYSTAYSITPPPPEILARRFTGKSILVSHEINKRHYRASGWLETNGHPLHDNDIPDYFQLDSPGVEISILGFDDSNMDEWNREARQSLVTHFFHAFVHDNLRVRIGSEAINSDSLDSIAANMDEKARRLIEVSRSAPVCGVDIDGIGKVKLRISVDEDGQDGQKTVALVRDAGMMITSQLGNMLISPSQRMLRFPHAWKGFTAVVECLSHGERSLLREAEGPRHDRISSDNADQSEKRQVRRALRQLGNWIRDAIEERAAPPPPSDSDSVTELADILPLPGGSESIIHGEGVEGYEVTQPEQSPRPPTGLRTPGRQNQVVKINLPGGDDPGNDPNPGSKKRKGGGTRSQTIQAPFHDLRRLAVSPSRWSSQWPKHTACFAFDRPEGAIKHIRLYAIGEDGKEIEVPIERALINGRRVKGKNGEIAEISQNQIQGDRIVIELKALRPIQDMRVGVKFSQ